MRSPSDDDQELKAGSTPAVVSAKGGGRWRRVAGRSVALAWIANGILLAVLIGWIYFDGRSLSALGILQDAGLRMESFDAPSSSARSKATDVTMLVSAAAIAGCTLLAMAMSLFFGPSRFRSLRAWLLFTLLVGGWLGALMAGPEIYWLGQQRRMARVLAPAEEMARRLDASWPVEDGDLPDIGPYLAYPKGRPTLVLPLKWVSFPTTALRFSAIERSNDGVVRFELTGSEAGAWLEWRADDRPPQPFKSGLEMSYNVARQRRLAPHWYLVRYRLAAVDFSQPHRFALCPISRFC